MSLEKSRVSSAAKRETSRAYLEAALDCVVMADAAGRVVEFNAAAERTFGYSRQEAVGRTVGELIVPPLLRDRHSEAFARFAQTREPTLLGRRLELTGMRADGSEFPVELVLSLVEGEPLLICGALRDLSEVRRAQNDLRTLADEQAALRRVATLVAREATPTEVFAAVAEEVARTLDVALTAVVRYEADGTATQVGAWGLENPFPVGTGWPLDQQSVSGLVARTGRPARVDDYAQISGEIAATLAREAGIRTAAGVPVLVDGRPWGVIMALSTEQRPLPAGTEDRLAAFTELIATAIANTQARDELRQLVDEQTALRRVATLVAQGSPPADVFAVMAEQVGHLLDVPAISMVRFEPDGTSTAIAVWGHGNPFGAGAKFDPYPGVMSEVRRTGRPARLEDYADSTGPTTARLQAAGIQSGVGVPIVVDGHVWGTTIALATEKRTLPPGIEVRLTSFTELVAMAISNIQARNELIASRARIVAAGDEARRRIERNLHDGTQQRLVSLGLDLQAVSTQVPAGARQAHTNLARIGHEMEAIVDEVRELSRGLHPALLARGGLQPSLRALARRSPIPVELEVSVKARPPESIETAAYYVVSEALTNAAKHARASTVSVTVTTSDDVLRATIEDDGLGGAEPAGGSGLVGLVDRVEALGGRLVLDSPSGEGTRIAIQLPLASQHGDVIARIS